ncbi:MAG: hypothetical protein JSS75_07290 [Bacteroidetes bacterium]|nr:hypothetical protein [Bacteroidota bacterium]
MNKKRLTTSQRETREREALTRRVTDIYIGATGQDPTNEEEFFLDIESAERLIYALKIAFMEGDDSTGNQWLFREYNIGNFAQVSKAVDFLYRNGVRA